MKICSYSAVWEGEDIVCSQITCGVPTNISHALVTVTGFRVDDRASYECEEGYTVKSGSPSIFCLSNAEWSGTTFTCAAIDCVMPPEIPQTKVRRLG